MSSPQAAGAYAFLRTCIDNRFVAPTRDAFEEFVRKELGFPDFGPTSYWHEAYAGGSAKRPPGVPDTAPLYTPSDGETYAVNNGAYILGWQAHLDKCGGLPGVPDPEIRLLLDEVVQAKLAFYASNPHIPFFQLKIVADVDENGLPRVRIEIASPRR